MASMYKETPFPDKIFHEIGGGFAVGALGSIPYHTIRALRTMPKGDRSHFVQTSAAKTAGQFAIWAALYATIEGGMIYVRRKEDPCNSIWAGGLSAGLMSVRSGWGVAGRQFLGGGALMCFVHGVLIANESLKSIMAAENQKLDHPIYVDGPKVPAVPFLVPDDVVEPEASSSWFGGWFGGKKKGEGKGQEAHTKVLESFDLMPTHSL